MPSLITFGGLSARALGHLNGRIRKLKSLTFTSSQNWSVPAGVTSLASVQGRGGSGTPAGSTSFSAAIVNVNWMGSGTSGSGGSFDWGNFQGYAQGVHSDINGDGAATWTEYTYNVWPDGSNVLASQFTISYSGKNPGSFTLEGPTSGPATGSDTILVSGTETIAATTGASAYAFSLAFNGGTGGVQAALTTHNNVAVTPGNSYFLSIPAGGTIIINYYE